MDLTSVRITCRFLQSKSPLSLSRVSHPTVCQQQKLLEKAKKEPDKEKGDTVVVVQIGKAEGKIFKGGVKADRNNDANEGINEVVKGVMEDEVKKKEKRV